MLSAQAASKVKRLKAIACGPCHLAYRGATACGLQATVEPRGHGATGPRGHGATGHVAAGHVAAGHRPVVMDDKTAAGGYAGMDQALVQ